jgi:hypothetical protein
MFQTKVLEKIKARILGSFFFENSAVYEIMWKNIVDPDTQQMTIWCMRIVCWIPKAAKPPSEYVIHFAFPLHH